MAGLTYNPAIFEAGRSGGRAREIILTPEGRPVHRGALGARDPLSGGSPRRGPRPQAGPDGDRLRMRRRAYVQGADRNGFDCLVLGRRHQPEDARPGAGLCGLVSLLGAVAARLPGRGRQRISGRTPRSPSGCCSTAGSRRRISPCLRRGLPPRRTPLASSTCNSRAVPTVEKPWARDGLDVDALIRAHFPDGRKSRASDAEVLGGFHRPPSASGASTARSRGASGRRPCKGGRPRSGASRGGAWRRPPGR